MGAALLVCATGTGCRRDRAEPAFLPDSVLRAELGLTDADEVHRVALAGGTEERLDPAEVVIAPGAWVEFATVDWRLHVIRFEVDSLTAEARAFLETTGQTGSPPLVDRDARFVVSFADAPTGRYPYLAEGNGSPGRGVVVVLANR